MTTLADLIDDWAPRLQRAFLKGVYRIRSEAEIGLIVSKLERGDVPGALEAVGISPVQFRALDAELAAAYEAGGTWQGERFPALKLPDRPRIAITFDVRNERAEAWLRDYSSTLVREIVEDQRAAIRTALERGMSLGSNPREVALGIVGRINRGTGNREGGIIGLTSEQEGWAASYEQALRDLDPAALEKLLRDARFDGTVRAAIKAGKPIPDERIADMVAAYKNRALRLRGETIGRTEALSSLNAAAEEATRQAIDAGQLSAVTTRKIWRATKDRRTRDSHREMDGKSVDFSASFTLPSGAVMARPGDPKGPGAERINCRCWVEFKTDFYAGLE